MTQATEWLYAIQECMGKVKLNGAWLNLVTVYKSDDSGCDFTIYCYISLTNIAPSALNCMAIIILGRVGWKPSIHIVYLTFFI